MTIHLDKETQAILADPKRRPAWVKYQLALRGLSLADLAVEDHTTPNNFSQVWRKAFPRVEQILAERLGLTPQDLFPERYDADGKPVPRGTKRWVRKDKRITRAIDGARNVNAGKAA